MTTSKDQRLSLAAKRLSKANEWLIREYLEIATKDSENIERTLNILNDDCVWRITPPGIEFRGKDQLRPFIGMGMGSRSHRGRYRVEIRNCFTDGEHLCVEYFHGAIATRFRFKVAENVCLVCHMKDGKFDRIHEYVDTSGSILVSLGLRLLPFMTKGRRSKPKIEK
jgi:ketosteroid isomerase-like protein